MLLEFEKHQKYILIEETKIETGCGGLYQAQDLNLGRTVAVKYIQIPGEHRKEKQLYYQKSYSEIRAMVSLAEDNVNIPHIYETHYDEKNSVLYIIMEWIKGRTLADIMTVPELTFLQWMINLCDILSVMERKNLYHKDIKPANIMITETDKLYLIDFNISIETPNLVEGTVNYKAPEMSRKSKYQGREKVDMFSIGVMMYGYYTGSVPVNPGDYAKNRSRGPLEWDKFIEPKEKNINMEESVNAIIVKCMKLDPKSRYRNYSELKYELVKAVKKIRWLMKQK
ncbi:MAG: serine/threonine-protein kinase [Anaerovoracaceae bacterium]|jgi:serine/threonine protein kinase